MVTSKQKHSVRPLLVVFKKKTLVPTDVSETVICYGVLLVIYKTARACKYRFTDI